MKQRVLIVEDDPDIIEFLKLYLENSNFEVLSAENGEQALTILERESIDIALIDIMMPGMNGYELLHCIRDSSDLPVIIISAKSADTDRIFGLDIGADAYITKPFNPLEVIAYIKTILRRQGNSLTSDKSNYSNRIILGELELDTEKLILRKNGKIIPLTAAELKIVSEMMHSPGRIFTKAQLYTCINGELYESDDNTMAVHIYNLRSKIEDDSANPQYIHTIRGLGYKIEDARHSN